MKKPNLFIIGAPKCGTTALRNYLATHPFVFMSYPKEPHFFCKDLKAGGLPLHSEEEYLNAFFENVKKEHHVIGEASVWYLYSKVAVSTILDFSPKSKFIVMVRNPVDMAYSLYSQFIFSGQEDLRDFRRAWALQSERLAGRRIPKGFFLDKKFLQYGELCKLGKQLKRVYEVVPKDQVMVIVFDDFVKHTPRVYEDVLSFLGLPHDGRSEFPKINASITVKPEVFANFLRSRIVVQSVITAKRLLRIKSLSVGRIQPPMPLDLRKELAEYFYGDVQELSSLVERDLSHWLRVR